LQPQSREIVPSLCDPLSKFVQLRFSDNPHQWPRVSVLVHRQQGLWC
jgi:hypothetical protein